MCNKHQSKWKIWKEGKSQSNCGKNRQWTLT
jgi:hypothetical protein